MDCVGEKMEGGIDPESTRGRASVHAMADCSLMKFRRIGRLSLAEPVSRPSATGVKRHAELRPALAEACLRSLRTMRHRLRVWSSISRRSAPPTKSWQSTMPPSKSMRVGREEELGGCVSCSVSVGQSSSRRCSPHCPVVRCSGVQPGRLRLLLPGAARMPEEGRERRSHWQDACSGCFWSCGRWSLTESLDWAAGAAGAWPSESVARAAGAIMAGTPRGSPPVLDDRLTRVGTNLAK